MTIVKAEAGRVLMGRAGAGAGRMSGAEPPAGGKAQGKVRGAQAGGGRRQTRARGAGPGAGQRGRGEAMEVMNTANRAGRSARAS